MHVKERAYKMFLSVCNQDLPVLAIGDYNVIVVEGKKKGGQFWLVRKFVILGPLLQK